MRALKKHSHLMGTFIWARRAPLSMYDHEEVAAMEILLSIQLFLVKLHNHDNLAGNLCDAATYVEFLQ